MKVKKRIASLLAYVFILCGCVLSVLAADGDERTVLPTLRYQSHVQDYGWEEVWKADGETSGTVGKGKRVEAFQMNLENVDEGYGVEYQSHIQDYGWESGWKSGEISGSVGESKRLEAIKIRLKGGLEEQYDIYYRVHVQNIGWLDWAKNGNPAGSEGLAYRVEAIEAVLVEKDGTAPGKEEVPFVNIDWNTNFVQQGESTNVVFLPEALSAMKTSGVVTTLEVDARMEYNGKVTRRCVVEKSIADIDNSGIGMDFHDYGKFVVTIRYKNGNTVIKTEEKVVPVVASEYNLAPLSATFPVVYFSLSYWDIGVNPNTGAVVPTIVMLDRPSAYNWDELPQGMFGNPYMTAEDIRIKADYTAFEKYVKDLVEISPNSKFNLYINDITCSLIHRYIYANRIPEGQYKIYMLSDGSASYSFTNEAYDVEDPVQKHEELVKTWQSGKEEAIRTGKISDEWGWHKHWDCMYAVMSCEPDTEWWVARNNLFVVENSPELQANIQNAVKRVNVNQLLNNLTAKGEDTVAAFKALYDFNDGYFSEAEVQGKTPMMLMGTYVNREKNFGDYARLTKLYYGEDYLYYYKGHPNTPTGLWPSKQEQLNSLDITDVDSSIAAELILFFNPEIRLSGYGTSTFNSASAEMACGLFDMKKENALQVGSSVDYSGIDWFASEIDKSVDERIQELCVNGNTNYLVEFSDEILSKNEYEFAIFDATKGVLRWYKKDEGGNYVEVKKRDEGNALQYSAHVSDFGWLPTVKAGQTAGTEGQSKKLEALKISLGSVDYSGSVEYRAHVENIGWQTWKKDGQVAGTEGRAYAIEALQIQLTGEMAEHYDVYYQVHSQNYGWLGWAKNGEPAGTQGFGLRAEAVNVVLVEKGGNAPGSVKNAFAKDTVQYKAHVAQIGWQNWTSEGSVAGTSGQALAMEALQIKLKDSIYKGDIQYQAHIAQKGWMSDWIKSGTAGTVGQSLPVEAFKIKLTGEMAEHYDIYYRVHSQDFGWLGWAKNGEAAGTEGCSKRIEAIQIQLVFKGAEAPGKTEQAFIKR